MHMHFANGLDLAELQIIVLDLDFNIRPTK